MNNQLTYLSEAPLVNPSASPGLDLDWMMGVATWPSSMYAFLSENVRPGSCGRTSQASLVPLKAQTSPASCPPGPEETSPLRSSAEPDSSKETSTPLPGAYLMHSISEYHSAAEESSLSDILETIGDHLLPFYLSATACAGILRRAERRGKQLPTELEKALVRQSQVNGVKEVADPLALSMAISADQLMPDKSNLQAVLCYDTTSISSPVNGSNPKPRAYDLRGREGGSVPEGPHDTANIRASSGGSSRSYVHQTIVRRLTPLECERLQGFPDGYTAIPGAANTPRYQAIGNSMAVPVMHWIGERIDAMEKLKILL